MKPHSAELPLLQRPPPAKVVVFRALQLGDMLCALPALRALRTALGSAHIALVGLPWARQFTARYAHYVDEFIEFPGHPDLPEQVVRQELLPDFYARMRSRRFDLAIQLHGRGPASNGIVQAFGARAWAGFGDGPNTDQQVLLPYPDRGHESCRLLALMAALGAPSSRTELEFPVSAADELELAESAFADQLQMRPYVCIHPGARAPDRRWPPVRFAAVADALARAGDVEIVLTGSVAERELTAAVARHMRHRAIDTASPLSIGAMAAIFRSARLLIANDTGASHIASALGLASVIIFSNSDMERWAPMNKQLHRCLWDPEGARVEDVLAHAQQLLAKRFSGPDGMSRLAQQCNSSGQIVVDVPTSSPL